MQIHSFSKVSDKKLPALLQPVRRNGAAGPHDLRRALLLLAPRPAYGVTLALAGMVERAWERHGMDYLPIAGLDGEATRTMFSVHFPGAQALIGSAWQSMRVPADFVGFTEAEFIDRLAQLLIQHRTVEDEDSRWLAHAVATASRGSESLWQVLYFSSPTVFDDLMHSFFTSLAVCNRNGQDWKVFLFERVEAERARYRQAPVG
ncbi:MAG: nitrogen fixation protein NifQ [Rhodocyclaceae bacterium]